MVTTNIRCILHTFFVLKDPSTLDVSSSSTTLIGGTVGGVIVIALLVVAAVVLLVMLLKRKRMGYKLSGDENGLGISNAVYGGRETKHGYQQIFFLAAKMCSHNPVN